MTSTRPRSGFIADLTTTTIVAELSLTAVMVTHAVAQALRHGDRILMLDRGEIRLRRIGK